MGLKSKVPTVVRKQFSLVHLWTTNDISIIIHNRRISVPIVLNLSAQWSPSRHLYRLNGLAAVTVMAVVVLVQ